MFPVKETLVVCLDRWNSVSLRLILTEIYLPVTLFPCNRLQGKGKKETSNSHLRVNRITSSRFTKI